MSEGPPSSKKGFTLTGMIPNRLRSSWDERKSGQAA